MSQYLKKYNKINQLNLGYVTGLSVQEVINTVKPVTGKPINIIYSERRAGNLASLIADSAPAQSELG